MTSLDQKWKQHSNLEEKRAAAKTRNQETVKCQNYVPIPMSPDIGYPSCVVGRFSSGPSVAGWAGGEGFVLFACSGGALWGGGFQGYDCTEDSKSK